MAYLVVNHVSDESKQEGFVESYQMVNIEVQNEDGTTSIVPKRMNFVHWPQLPTPFLHEEWSDDLTFVTVYVPENDTDNDEDSELNETIVELLENDYPEVYQAILSEALAEEPEDDEDEESEEIQAN